MTQRGLVCLPQPRSSVALVDGRSFRSAGPRGSQVDPPRCPEVVVREYLIEYERSPHDMRGARNLRMQRKGIKLTLHVCAADTHVLTLEFGAP